MTPLRHEQVFDHLWRVPPSPADLSSRLAVLPGRSEVPLRAVRAVQESDWRTVVQRDPALVPSGEQTTQVGLRSHIIAEIDRYRPCRCVGCRLLRTPNHPEAADTLPVLSIASVLEG